MAAHLLDLAMAAAAGGAAVLIALQAAKAARDAERSKVRVPARRRR